MGVEVGTKKKQPKIAPKLKHIVVFNGDVDPCVSYEGTRNAIQQVGFDVIEGGSYRPWFFNKKKASLSFLEEKPNLFGPTLDTHDAGAQWGGHVVNYHNNLSFVTVHGSGHMVPQFQPQSAFRLLQNVLSGSLFSPLLPSDDEILKMSEEEFDKSVDSWTKEAKEYI